MGSKQTYDFVNNNPSIELRRIDYVDNPMTIARHNKMTAINTVLQMDLTGQASAETLGSVFYSGITGFANFIRATLLAKQGNHHSHEIHNQEWEVSKIVPTLTKGAGVSLHRGDVQYIVTEYGIAYLQGRICGNELWN